MASVSWIPAAASIASMVFGASGTRTAVSGASSAAAAARDNAARQQAADEFTAQQLDVNAGQAIASGQRAAAEQRRQANLVQSRAIAVAAAGGGSIADPTVVTLLGRVQGEGAYRAAVAQYQSEDQARVMRMQAAAARYEGQTAIASGEDRAQAYETQGRAAALSGAGQLFNSGGLFAKYALGGPTPAATAGVLDAGTDATALAAFA